MQTLQHAALGFDIAQTLSGHEVIVGRTHYIDGEGFYAMLFARRSSAGKNQKTCHLRIFLMEEVPEWWILGQMVFSLESQEGTQRWRTTMKPRFSRPRGVLLAKIPHLQVGLRCRVRMYVAPMFGLSEQVTEREHAERMRQRNQ